MLMLALACSFGSPCPHLGLTEAEVRARFPSVPGETGITTIARDRDVLRVEVDHIPDDSVAARSYRMDLERDEDGVERTCSCTVWERCQPGRGWGLPCS
jgi:hypothetical protein